MFEFLLTKTVRKNGGVGFMDLEIELDNHFMKYGTLCSFHVAMTTTLLKKGVFSDLFVRWST